MKPLSLFNAPLYKTMALFVLILLLAFSGSGSFAMEGSVDRIGFFYTDCTSFLGLRLDGTFRGVNADRYNADVMALVVYDYYGNVLVFNPTINIMVGQSFGGIAIGSFMERIPAARPFTAKLFDTNTRDLGRRQAEASPLFGSISVDPATYGMCSDLSLNPPLPSNSTNEVFENPSFTDGRINNYDMAASVVLYGHDYETGRGLVVYSPQGALLLEVRPEDLANVVDCPEENALIVRSGDVALYRLSDCRYQLNAPSLDGTKTYVLIFDSLYNTGYISYEE